MMATKPSAAVWSESYRVEIRGLDDDHFILISLVSELQEAACSRRARAAVEQILSNLVAYIKIHFSREERLMAHHDYPDYETHRALHDGFARKTLEFFNDYQHGDTEIPAEVLNSLKNWIVDHIVTVDRKLALYLRERGVR